MKVYRILFLLLALFSFSWLQAGVVTEEQALQKAEQFLKGKKIKSRAATRGEKKSGEDFGNAFYVFNVENNGGFVIISGDDRTPEILGYATNGEMDLDNLPSNVKAWLKGYQEQIQALDLQKTRCSTRGGNWTVVPEGNLIKTKWGQGSPYNLKCPVFKNENQEDQNSITGCVATAIAQIMNYWKCPANGYLRSFDAYDVQEWDNNTYQMVTLFTVPAIDAVTIDWNKLKTRYGYNETNEAAQQVAELMRHVGQSEYMQYGLYSSGANTTQGNWLQNFGYNKAVAQFIYRDNYSTEEWEEIIYNEVSNGRPVLYDGFSNTSGHAFICDGYAGEGRFWINWGWDGYCDGQYLLSVLNDDGSGIGKTAGEVNLGDGYNYNQGAYIGIQPAKGNEGKVFTAPSSEGQEITFMISSDDNGNRTCVVGDGSNPAIGYNYNGVLTIPSQVSYDNKTYDVVAINKEAFNSSQVTSVNLPSTLKKLNSRSFAYCYSLTSLKIPNSVTEISVGAIYYCPNLQTLTVKSGNAKYTSANNAIIEGGTKIILGCNGTSEIPSTVTEIGIGAFEELQNLNLTIPQTVTKIGERAFAWCFNCVFTVEYDTPLDISDDTFNGAGGNYCFLKVPTGKKSLYQTAPGWSVFGNNIMEGDEGTEFKAQVGGNTFDILFTITGSKTVKVGSRSSQFDKQAVDRELFNGYQPTQTAIIIPRTVEYNGKTYTVTEIGDYAFRDIAFKTISLPSTLTKIGTWVFVDNWNVQELVIPKSVTEISEGVIINCSNLTTLAIADGGNKIYTSPNNNVIIENGTKILAGTRSTVIPNDIKAIGENAFRGIYEAALTIPRSVTTIGQYAFAWCSNCVFTVEKDTPIEIDEYTFEGVGNNGCVLKVPAGTKAAYKAAKGWSVFGDNIMEGDEGTEFKAQVGGNAFDMTFTITGSNTVKVGSLTANWNIPAVDRVLFNGDYENNIQPTQTAIVVPKTVEYNGKTYKVTEIGDYAFCNINFKTIALPTTLTKIGAYAFASNYDMSMTIPQSVTTIGQWAFAWCSNCVFTVEKDTPIEIDKYTFESTGDYCVLKVPAGSKSAYKSAQGWSVFGNNIMEGDEGTEFKAQVGGNAFDILFTITGSKTVKVGSMTPQFDKQAVDRELFNGGENTPPTQTAIIIPKTVEYNGKTYKVTEIGDYAFRNIAFKTISLPSTLTKIGTWVFVDNWNVQKLVIPKSVTEISEGAIINCGNLTTLAIKDGGNDKYTSPNNNVIIENGTKIILGIRTTVIPDAVTEIGRGAFRGVSDMNLTIPKKVTTIGEEAFAWASNCVFTVEYETPIIISESVFMDAPRNNCILIVPKGMKSTYLETEGWNVFPEESIMEFEEKIVLNTTELVIAKGQTEVLTATCPSSWSNKKVTWESSNTKVATVSSSGKVKGVKTGTATITCTSVATGAKATCEVTVAQVKLNKTEISIQKGEKMALKATVYPTTLEDQSVTWESSDKKVATVSETGEVTGVKTGTATITCISNATGLNATCEVTVGQVKLNKSEVTIQKGKAVTLKATVYPTTLDQSVTWKSSDSKIATVSEVGKVTGVKTGTATITCTSAATGLSATCEVTVGQVKLSKTEVAIQKGKTVTLKATVYPTTEDQSVTWKSSDKNVVTVSSTGTVTGVKTGTATITCTSNATGLSATCEVTVGQVKLSKTEVTIQKGKAVTLKATVYPTTLEDQSVTWESSNTKIATVSETGKVKGVRTGTVKITCISNATGLSATCTVTVTAPANSRSLGGGDDEVTGIDDIDVDPAVIEPFDVYDISGRKVRHQVTSLDGLPNGVYIVNGKKVLKKD